MSLFGRKVVKSESEGSMVRATGGNVDGVVMSLLGACEDPDPIARRSMKQALQDIGDLHPELVTSSGLDFLMKRKKIRVEHRTAILQSLVAVSDRKKADMTLELAASLIKFAADDMVSSKDIVPDWQQAASSLIVSLGSISPDVAMDALLSKYEAGTVPHYFIMKSLGDFASSDPIHFVPRLREVLARVLPTLGMAKHDNQKWAFASGLGHFCEAIVTYCANIEQHNDSTINEHSFASEMDSAFDMLFSRWLQSGEQKVRLAAAQALGSMSAVMSTSVFRSWLDRLIPAMLLLLKKENVAHQHPITAALSMIVYMASTIASDELQPLLPSLLSGVFPVVCAGIDFSNPAMIKNHNEVLRVFEILCNKYPDVVITDLEARMEQRTPTLRIGLFTVLKHLVTRLESTLESRRGRIVASVKPMVSDKDYASRKALAQLIAAMAPKGYLEMEGGKDLVRFIVLNCSIPDAEIQAYRQSSAAKNPHSVSPNELRDMCDHVLNLLTTTIPCMEQVLWPFLLEHLVDPAYTFALPILSQCISYLGEKKRDDEQGDYLIDFDRIISLPKPSAIIARLIVILAADPLGRKQAGIKVLNMLKAIGPVLHVALTEMWDESLPKLAKYLEVRGANDDLDMDSWGELVMRLLTETINAVYDEEWTVTLARDFLEQVAFYNSMPSFKKICLKCIGVALKHSRHRDVIKSILDKMFPLIDHSSEDERLGCAQCFGICASGSGSQGSHIDIPLDKCRSIISDDMVIKTSGFLGLVKDKTQEDVERIKGTVFLCLGYIASYAEPDLLLSRVDTSIVSKMLPIYTPTALSNVRVACADATLLVAQSVNPSAIGSMAPDFHLGNRNTLINTLIVYAADTSSASTHKVKSASLAAISSLLKLPMIPSEDALGEWLGQLIKLYEMPEKEGAGDEAVFDELDTVFSTILELKCTGKMFSQLSMTIQPYLNHERADIKRRAFKSISKLTTKFISHLQAEEEEEEDTVVCCLDPVSRLLDGGVLLGSCVPRICDVDPVIRKSAIECIGLLLFVDFLMGNTINDRQPGKVDAPEELKTLEEVRGRVSISDLGVHYSAIKSCSSVISCLITSLDLPSLLYTLISRLLDVSFTPFSAAGAAVAINSVLQSRVNDLGSGSESTSDTNHVGEVMDNLLDTLDKIKKEEEKIRSNARDKDKEKALDNVINGTLHACRLLASIHMSDVLEQLLIHDLPHPDSIVRTVQVLSRDDGLMTTAIDVLCEACNSGQPYELKACGKKKGKEVFQKVVGHRGRAAIVTLKEFIEGYADSIDEDDDDEDNVIVQNYSKLLSCFLLRLGIIVDAEGDRRGDKEKEKTVKEIFDTLSLFFETTGGNGNIGLIGWGEECQETVKDSEEYGETIVQICKGVVEHRLNEVPKMCQELYPYLSRTYKEYRVIATAAMAQFITANTNPNIRQSTLLQQLISCLVSRITDECDLVRVYALRGMGNVGLLDVEDIDKYSSTVLSALIKNMDDNNARVCNEAINGLDLICKTVSPTPILPLLINVTLAVRSCLSREEESIRASSAMLFGTLTRFHEHVKDHSFIEQVHTALPHLVLFCNEDDPDVAMACRKTLIQIGGLLEASELKEYLSEINIDTRIPSYDEFLNTVARLLVTYYSDRSNFYLMETVSFFRCEWDTIKGNAVMFAGYILYNSGISDKDGGMGISSGAAASSASVSAYTSHTHSPINYQHSISAITQLLRDRSAVVRSRTGESLGLLRNI